MSLTNAQNVLVKCLRDIMLLVCYDSVGPLNLTFLVFCAVPAFYFILFYFNLGGITRQTMFFFEMQTVFFMTVNGTACVYKKYS